MTGEYTVDDEGGSADQIEPGPPDWLDADDLDEAIKEVSLPPGAGDFPTIAG